MGLKGKLIAEKEIKCHGDVFHELFRHKPHDISNITPHHYHGCDVHHDHAGVVGSTRTREYTHDGKKKSMKIVLEEIDEEKKLLKFKAVEGDILELYKEYSVSIHVDTEGDVHVVIWTIDYVKAAEDVVDPVSYLQLAINIIQGIEDHHANAEKKKKKGMGLKGKLVAEKEIRCHGDIFHDLFKHKPHEISKITPDHVHSCDVHEGQFGTVGSVLSWDFTNDGKKESLKVVIGEIDEEKKLVKFNVAEGEILEKYKEFVSAIHVDTKGDDHVVTWTLQYEKVREDVPDPISYLELAINIIKDIEAHHAT
ncbi:MLP-like protein 34 [Andrographis paniculata]|uniref:MLP-like protein 34 n=1 Tax=Andrographis paniculata TaxID=175694 RepID=UPI0021E8EBFF|nr:MLP-like protein 34 [Andrographis paniculata]